MNVTDVTTQLPFVGDVFGLSGPKTSLTFHWNGGLAGADPFPQLVADANLHISKGWGGISYHKAIGMDGTVYSCRNPDAIVAAVANADGNANSEMVQLMIGRTDDASVIQHPSPEMWASAAELARDAVAQGRPIYGHRDWSATECPGQEVYAWIQRQGWTGGTTDMDQAQVDTRIREILGVELGSSLTPNAFDARIRAIVAAESSAPLDQRIAKLESAPTGTVSLHTHTVAAATSTPK